MLTAFAPAKLNLYLHITGRRADGYHDLDSLVAFADIGDHVQLEPANSLGFEIKGPLAGTLQQEPTDNNLIIKAAQSLAKLVGKPLNVKFTLVKNLPVASGIGGGSSDAAAALRLLAQHWGIAANDPRLVTAAAEHGQDVPVCLQLINNYITATGTVPAHDLPQAPVVLVNPNRGLPTPAVYKMFREKAYAFSPPMPLNAAPATLNDLVTELQKRGNDLYKPACDIMPEIAGIIAALDATPCKLSRMSGSGATCFAFYETADVAAKAAAKLQHDHPGWWIAAGKIPFYG